VTKKAAFESRLSSSLVLMHLPPGRTEVIPSWRRQWTTCWCGSAASASWRGSWAWPSRDPSC